MIERWKSLSYTTKFSILAFFITATLGLLSMGLLGFVLYYLVSFLFSAYPDLNDWTGDWVWPAIIGAGMAWSFGFIFGGIAWHFLQKITNSKLVLRIVYIAILWLWAALLWQLIINSNVESLL